MTFEPLYVKQSSYLGIFGMIQTCNLADCLVFGDEVVICKPNTFMMERQNNY